jgi:hypothetical protein
VLRVVQLHAKQVDQEHEALLQAFAYLLESRAEEETPPPAGNTTVITTTATTRSTVAQQAEHTSDDQAAGDVSLASSSLPADPQSAMAPADAVSS